MELNIKNKIENNLLKRTELSISINSEGKATPKVTELRDLLAAQLGVQKELLVIRKIKQHFGGAAACEARLYKTKEELERIEPKYIIGRNTGAKIKGGANKKKEVAKA